MFTPAEQAKHCRQLVSVLKFIRDADYNHNSYATCALSHASHASIGGLFYLPGTGRFFLRGNREISETIPIVNTIFGEDAFRTIFSAYAKSGEIFINSLPSKEQKEAVMWLLDKQAKKLKGPGFFRRVFSRFLKGAA